MMRCLFVHVSTYVLHEYIDTWYSYVYTWYLNFTWYESLTEYDGDRYPLPGVCVSLYRCCNRKNTHEVVAGLYVRSLAYAKSVGGSTQIMTMVPAPDLLPCARLAHLFRRFRAASLVFSCGRTSSRNLAESCEWPSILFLSWSRVYVVSYGASTEWPSS